MIVNLNVWSSELIYQTYKLSMMGAMVRYKSADIAPTSIDEYVEKIKHPAFIDTNGIKKKKIMLKSQFKKNVIIYSPKLLMIPKITSETLTFPLFFINETTNEVHPAATVARKVPAPALAA